MSETGKKEMVRAMFDDISPKYDFLNHFLSMGIDKGWRRKLVKILSERNPGTVLDVATGTGDLAMAIARGCKARISGIDIAEKMIEIGQRKVEAAGLDGRITFRPGDAEKIPFSDGTFDAVTVAFGVRNYEDLPQGLREMRRVMRPGGLMLVLEFSHPERFPVRQLYAFYSRYIIPAAGRLISGHSAAYRYLPESVAAFPSGKRFLDIMEETGLKNVRQIPLTMGIASIYLGEK